MFPMSHVFLTCPWRSWRNLRAVPHGPCPPVKEHVRRKALIKWHRSGSFQQTGCLGARGLSLAGRRGMQLHYFSVSNIHVLPNMDTSISKWYEFQQSQTAAPCSHTQGPHPLCHCHFQDLRPAHLPDAKRAFPRHRGLFVLWARQYPWPLHLFCSQGAH